MSRFEIYSRHGLKLGDAASLVEAERLLGVWFNAAYIIEVLPDGKRRVAAERRELRP